MPEAKQPASILVYVGLDLVGDGLMKLPFIRALRRSYPNARITWLAGKGKSVFSGMLAETVEGLIDEVIDETPVGSRWSEMLSRPLPGRRFDLIIDSQRRLLTTAILKRIDHGLFISGAGNFLLSDKKPRRSYEKPRSMVAALFDLLDLATGGSVRPKGGLKITKNFKKAAQDILPNGKNYIGLSPGAGGKHKCWPLENFCSLAERLAAAGSTPVVFLGPGEADWESEVRRLAPNTLLPLQDEKAAPFNNSPLLTIALGSRLKAAVANDSGTGHMLAAADTPLVSLFGPTPPEKFAPFVSLGKIVTAQSFGSEEMSSIPVDAVSEALEDLLTQATKIKS